MSKFYGFTIWLDEEIIFPKFTAAPMPHNEMPESVERDYREARLVVDDSPRAAAALLSDLPYMNDTRVDTGLRAVTAVSLASLDAMMRPNSTTERLSRQCIESL